MYPVTGDDRVLKLDGIPKPDVGSPRPIVIASDGMLILAYVVDGPMDCEESNTIAGLPRHELIALITFVDPYAHSFGAPNDETVDGHPLAKRGLVPDTAAEVVNSSWIGGFVAMNAVHTFHDPDRFAGLRHFVLPFKDDCFECVATGYAVEQFRGSIPETAARMAAKIAEWHERE